MFVLFIILWSVWGMDGSVFEVGIQMGGNFVYFTGIVMGVYLNLCMGSKNGF